MNTMHRGLITLIKSGITGKSFPLPEGFDLEAAFPVIQQHHMATLIYDGAVRCGIPRQDKTMGRLFSGYCAMLMKSERQMGELRRIYTAFEENGIDYMPLKGAILKSLYRTAELRTMGDADVLIRVEQYPRIIPIMEELGFSAVQESDHELVWRSEGLLVELHKRLIPSYNRDISPYFGDGWQFAKRNAGYRHSMTEEDTFIFLFAHFAKHYRDGGIGCRYLADLWVYREVYPNMDEAYIRKILDKLRLEEFYDNILCLIRVWFYNEPCDDKMAYMTEYIFASGSWGQTQSRAIAQSVRRSKKAKVLSSGKLEYMITLLFPPVEVLQDKYTVLKKAPWLLPLVWFVRPFYKLLFERGTGKFFKQRLAEAGKMRYTREDVQNRQDMLHYVGLDFYGAEDAE